MKVMTVAAIAALGVAVSGCATIIKGTTQTISVNSEPVEGAKCVLTSSEGTYYVTTPGNVTVHKTKNDLNADCTRDGYRELHTVIKSDFNGYTAGNVIAGGVIGIGIDAASGANFEYPQATTVSLTPIGAPPPSNVIPPPPPNAPSPNAHPYTPSS